MLSREGDRPLMLRYIFRAIKALKKEEKNSLNKFGIFLYAKSW